MTVSFERAAASARAACGTQHSPLAWRLLTPEGQPRQAEASARRHDASLGASRELAPEVGGDPAHAKLASDIRFMRVSGYLHARLVNRRYPWSPLDVLRPAMVELVLEAMVGCLRNGPQKPPAPAKKASRGSPAQKS